MSLAISCISSHADEFGSCQHIELAISFAANDCSLSVQFSSLSKLSYSVFASIV
ncbi:hypothetical protein HOF65_06985 [bacterium]|nr:hypothetical protein [bacterium]